MTLDNILEEINKAESIVILTHENPDGDAKLRLSWKKMKTSNIFVHWKNNSICYLFIKKCPMV